MQAGQKDRTEDLRGVDLRGEQLLVTRSDALVSNSFLLLVIRPGAPSSVLAPSSDAWCVHMLKISEISPKATLHQAV